MELKVRKIGDYICETPQSCGLGLTETDLSKGFPGISAGSVTNLSRFLKKSNYNKIFFIFLNGRSYFVRFFESAIQKSQRNAPSGPCEVGHFFPYTSTTDKKVYAEMRSYYSLSADQGAGILLRT